MFLQTEGAEVGMWTKVDCPAVLSLVTLVVLISGQCCTLETPCSLGEGDCQQDEDCRGDLVTPPCNANSVQKRVFQNYFSLSQDLRFPRGIKRHSVRLQRDWKYLIQFSDRKGSHSFLSTPAIITCSGLWKQQLQTVRCLFPWERWLLCQANILSSHWDNNIRWVVTVTASEVERG